MKTEKELTTKEANQEILKILSKTFEVDSSLNFCHVLEILNINQTYTYGDAKKIINNTTETSQKTLARIEKDIN